MSEHICTCNLCQERAGRDPYAAQRAASIARLGRRWLLAVPPKQVAADIIVSVNWSPVTPGLPIFHCAPAKPPRPQLRLVK